MNQRNLFTTEQIQTTHLSKKGRGVSANKKLQVIGALPGEELLVLPFCKMKRATLASIQKIITPSSVRVVPRCMHVPDCGGCSLQQMDYQAQLLEKQRQIESLFAPLIATYTPQCFSILGCADPWHYRNKMEFSFSQTRAGEKFLGLIRAGSRGHVLNLTECKLSPDWFMKAREVVFQFFSGSSTLQAYSHHKDQGHLRTLTLRAAVKGTGKMAILTVSGNPDYALKRKEITAFVEQMKQTVEEEETLSIFLRIQQIGKGRPTQLFEMLLAGPDHITEKMEITIGEKSYPMEFKISPSSFFQPNTKQAEVLYSKALTLLSDLKDKRVFDLYCGGATLGLAAAKLAKEVVGIEINPHSVFDAEWNQEVNQSSNFQIYKGDVKTALTDLVPKIGKPDVIIVDPPRAGMDPLVLSQIHLLAPQEIVYISCHPETQARDIALFLEKGGYRLAIIAPIDQFPHTNHIENICILKKI